MRIEAGPTSGTAIDPYRGAGQTETGAMHVLWKPRGLLLGTVAVALVLAPRVWIASPYLVLPFAALALIAFGTLALEQYEITNTGASISLYRGGLPMQVERIGQRRPRASSDPYRTVPVSRESPGLRLRWRPRGAHVSWVLTVIFTTVAG